MRTARNIIMTLIIIIILKKCESEGRERESPLSGSSMKVDAYGRHPQQTGAFSYIALTQFPARQQCRLGCVFPKSLTLTTHTRGTRDKRFNATNVSASELCQESSALSYIHSP